jgi:hypothetical protein
MAAVITSLNPESAPVGGADFTLHVIGTGFTPDAAIVFTGGAPTTFVSATELTTVANEETPGLYPLRVQQADGTSNQVEFEFTPEVVEPPPPVELHGRCFNLCPPPADCVLPTPWPPAPVPAP